MTTSSLLKKRLGWLFSILLVCFFYVAMTEERPIKIACVGDSITYGASIKNREKNAYPAQLGAMLGKRFDVRNFGRNSTTLLQHGNFPYRNQIEYQQAIAYKPDIVFIKFGSNDSKAVNRPYFDEFESDYKQLLADFKQANPNVRVILLLPIPSLLQDSTSIWTPVLRKEIIPRIQNVAFEQHTEVIDLFQCLVDQPGLLPDKIHPNGLGASIIARRLYEEIVRPTVAPLPLEKTLEKNPAFSGKRTSNFYGYTSLDFKLNQVDCKIVSPPKPAVGYPWVLRARFWGHQPQTDIALLERGFHIAYCDVANLYGNSEAMKRWDAFYDQLIPMGFSRKVVLEGMSRGGLPVYHWAIQHPDRIACIYADAPVLNAKSWPGSYSGSKPNWEEFKQKYGFADDAAFAQGYKSIIDQAQAVAQGGYPMLHVCGAIDHVVPVAENTEPFAQAVRSYGGSITTIYKPNVDHHPHSLENPKPIVDFILRATQRKINFATIAAPSAEYRLAAGWTKGDWWTQANDIDSICRATKNVDILFIGNSITQGWGGNRPNVSYKPGLEAANQALKGETWISAGISGDRTQHVLWRLENGRYEACNPAYVVLAIGVNNFIEADSDEEIAAGISKIVQTIELKFPRRTKILLFGLLPTGVEAQSERRQTYLRILKRLEPLGEMKRVRLCTDVLPQFTDAQGKLTNTYGGDGIHLTEEGYKVWATLVASNIQALEKTPSKRKK